MKSYQRLYQTLQALRNGETIDLDGIKLVMDDGPIKRGDLYIGERNIGPVLLTAADVNEDGGWIRPTTFHYSYNIWECVKVREE